MLFTQELTSHNENKHEISWTNLFQTGGVDSSSSLQQVIHG